MADEKIVDALDMRRVITDEIERLRALPDDTPGFLVPRQTVDEIMWSLALDKTYAVPIIGGGGWTARAWYRVRLARRYSGPTTRNHRRRRGHKRVNGRLVRKRRHYTVPKGCR